MTASLGADVQRQATTAVVLREIGRLRTQGEMMVRSLDMVEHYLRVGIDQAYAIEAQGEVLEALGREAAVDWGSCISAAGVLLRETA